MKITDLFIFQNIYTYKQNTRLTLNTQSYIVGPNGTGKSSLLRLIKLAFDDKYDICIKIEFETKELEYILFHRHLSILFECFNNLSSTNTDNVKCSNIDLSTNISDLNLNNITACYIYKNKCYLHANTNLINLNDGYSDILCNKLNKIYFPEIIQQSALFSAFKTKYNTENNIDIKTNIDTFLNKYNDIKHNINKLFENYDDWTHNDLLKIYNYRLKLEYMFKKESYHFDINYPIYEAEHMEYICKFIKNLIIIYDNYSDLRNWADLFFESDNHNISKKCDTLQYNYNLIANEEILQKVTYNYNKITNKNFRIAYFDNDKLIDRQTYMLNHDMREICLKCIYANACDGELYECSSGEKELIYLLTFIGVGSKKYKLFKPILILDEPGIYLSKDYIFKFNDIMTKKYNGCQYIVITHNPNALTFNIINNDAISIYYLQQFQNNTGLINIKDIKNIIKHIYNSVDILFNNNIICVEGPSDKKILDIFFREHTNKPLNYLIIEIGGCNSKLPDIMSHLHIKYITIYDLNILYDDLYKTKIGEKNLYKLLKNNNNNKVELMKERENRMNNDKHIYYHGEYVNIEGLINKFNNKNESFDKNFISDNTYEIVSTEIEKNKDNFEEIAKHIYDFFENTAIQNNDANT